MICELKNDNLDKLKSFEGKICKLSVSTIDHLSKQLNNSVCADNDVHRIDEFIIQRTRYDDIPNSFITLHTTRWDHEKMRWGAIFHFYGPHRSRPKMKWINIEVVLPEEYIMYKLLE